jgi:hypothetical protein
MLTAVRLACGLSWGIMPREFRRCNFVAIGCVQEYAVVPKARQWPLSKGKLTNFGNV